MEYQEEISALAAANIEELRADLDRARNLQQRARIESSEMDRQVAALEALIELAEGETAEPEPSGITLHAAMVEVLSVQPQGMLRAGDLAAEIDRRRLYKMRDGRPVEAQQIHARVGHYGHLFEKEGTFIKLACEKR